MDFFENTETFWSAGIFFIIVCISLFIYKQEQLEIQQSLKNLRIVGRSHINKKNMLEEFKRVVLSKN